MLKNQLNLTNNLLLLIERQDETDDETNNNNNGIIQSTLNPNLDNSTIPINPITTTTTTTSQQQSFTSLLDSTSTDQLQSNTITNTITNTHQLTLSSSSTSTSTSIPFQSSSTFIPIQTTTSDLPTSDSTSLFPTSTSILPSISTSSSLPFSSPTSTFIPTSTLSIIPTSTSTSIPIESTTSTATITSTSQATSTSTTFTSTTHLSTFTSTQTFTTDLVSTHIFTSISHILSSQADGSIQTITTLVPFTQLTSIATVLLKPTQITNPNLNGSDSNSSNHILSTPGGIVGVILGIGAALILTIGTGVLFFLRRKRSRDQQREFEDELQMGSDFGDHGLYHDDRDDGLLDLTDTLSQSQHLNHHHHHQNGGLNSANSHSDQFLISPITDLKSSNEKFWGLNGGFSLENHHHPPVGVGVGVGVGQERRGLQEQQQQEGMADSPSYSNPYFGSSDQTHLNTMTFRPGPTWPESTSNQTTTSYLLNGYHTDYRTPSHSQDQHHFSPNPNPIHSPLRARRNMASPQPSMTNHPSPSSLIDHSSNPHHQDPSTIDPILLNLDPPHQFSQNPNRSTFHHHEDRSSTPRPNLNNLHGYRHHSSSTLQPSPDHHPRRGSMGDESDGYSIGNFVAGQRRAPIDSQLSSMTFDQASLATMTADEWGTFNHMSHLGPHASSVDESHEFRSPLFSEESNGTTTRDEDEDDHRLGSIDDHDHDDFDDRLDRNVLSGYQHRNDQLDEISLRDETDYSRRILTVSNPDDSD